MATSSAMSAGMLPGRSVDPLSVILLFLRPSPFVHAGEYPSRSVSSSTPRVLSVPLISRESASLNRIVRRFILDYRRGRIKLCLGNPLFSDQNIALLKALCHDRSYYGVPLYYCKRCDASFWYLERSKSDRRGKGCMPVYSTYCLRGKVSLPGFTDWPSPLK